MVDCLGQDVRSGDPVLLVIRIKFTCRRGEQPRTRLNLKRTLHNLYLNVVVYYKDQIYNVKSDIYLYMTEVRYRYTLPQPEVRAGYGNSSHRVWGKVHIMISHQLAYIGMTFSLRTIGLILHRVLRWPKKHKTSRILVGIGFAVTIYKTIPSSAVYCPEFRDFPPKFGILGKLSWFCPEFQENSTTWQHCPLNWLSLHFFLLFYYFPWFFSDIQGKPPDFPLIF